MAVKSWMIILSGHSEGFFSKEFNWDKTWYSRNHYTKDFCLQCEKLPFHMVNYQDSLVADQETHQQCLKIK